ncbi:MAG: hypothetical protein ABSE62_02760 [Chthoniobacteraceae bacterium]|jgi:hypothetical protein
MNRIPFLSLAQFIGLSIQPLAVFALDQDQSGQDKSRDVRENRGTRRIKTTIQAQSFSRGR